MTKRKNPEDKKTAGRPTIFSPDIIDKLETAFSWGAGDLEACFYAGISKSALYDYQKRNPEFAERKEILKEKMIFQARKVINDAMLEGDKETAKWYLERKKKSEFTTRQEVTGADGTSLMRGVVVEFVGVNSAGEDTDTGEGEVSLN